MPIFTYVAMNAQGEQRRGQLEAADKNELVQLLQAENLFLVSQEGVVEPAPVVAEVKPDVREDEKKISDWPVKSPSQYVVMAVIFVICVFVGYLLGR